MVEDLVKARLDAFPAKKQLQEPARRSPGEQR
jgi:hypothetical protein